MWGAGLIFVSVVLLTPRFHEPGAGAGPRRRGGVEFADRDRETLSS